MHDQRNCPCLRHLADTPDEGLSATLSAGLDHYCARQKGGLRLSKEPHLIHLGAVVRSIEPGFALVECLGSNNKCKIAGKCPLTGILNGAVTAFLHHLSFYTLADIISPVESAQRFAPMLAPAPNISTTEKPEEKPNATPVDSTLE